jgi:hypothetical protein
MGSVTKDSPAGQNKLGALPGQDKLGIKVTGKIKSVYKTSN